MYDKALMRFLCALAAALSVACAALAAPADALEGTRYAEWSDEAMGMRVYIPEGITAKLNEADGIVYLYPLAEDSIPYVGVYRYAWDDLETFPAALDETMRGWYPDHELVVGAWREETVGWKWMVVNEYRYTVEGGHRVRDTRAAFRWGVWTYMFMLKELPALGQDYSDLLWNVVERFEPIGSKWE